uniref:Acetylcholine receptor subunit beta-like n=1 Tax=Crassostrea virginica TaxID=6565 RepID=A0A8B8BB62_CRAVI|nr:acetylcholine receptor subunit beta-like [Crassostrea virginica]
MILIFIIFQLFIYVFGNELTLRSHLFDPNRHNPNVLPKKSSQPITINLSWLTATVAGFDEIDGKFNLMGSLKMTWKNEHLTWDPVQYNVSSIVVFGKEVWTPPIYVANQMDSNFLDAGLQNDLMRIDHTGLDEIDGKFNLMGSLIMVS